MNAPLSRYLTSFAPRDARELFLIAPPAAAAEPESTSIIEPADSALDLALREARQEAERELAKANAALEATHAQAIEDALVAARADWAATNAEAIGISIDTAFARLREVLSDRLAAVLRPMLAEAILARTMEVLTQTIDQILADPDHPCLTVRGPSDLVEALRARAPESSGTIYETADRVDVIVAAEGIHIETRLGHALAALDGLEPKA